MTRLPSESSSCHSRQNSITGAAPVNSLIGASVYYIMLKFYRSPVSFVCLLFWIVRCGDGPIIYLRSRHLRKDGRAIHTKFECLSTRLRTVKRVRVLMVRSSTTLELGDIFFFKYRRIHTHENRNEDRQSHNVQTILKNLKLLELFFSLCQSSLFGHSSQAVGKQGISTEPSFLSVI